MLTNFSLRYDITKKTVQAQLAKIEQNSQRDLAADSVSLEDLHTRLQEIQVHCILLDLLVPRAF